MTTTISVAELNDYIRSGKRIVVIDARWARDETSYSSYTRAHIPLAAFCNPPFDLVGVPSREAGRNPLPHIDRVEEAVRRWGIRDDSHVIVYDSGDGLFAARAWWILKWAGIRNVQVLTGGLRAWDEAEYGTSFGPGNLPQTGNAHVSPNNMPVVEVAEVLTWSTHGVLIDAREEDRYIGRRERVDLQAGHIPGAINLPARSLQTPAGDFLPPEQLRQKLGEAGIHEGVDVAVYSGSGLHASIFVQAMEEAGLPIPAHYVGGWSQWAGDPTLPIVRL